jgi:hypothetical protein
MTHQVSSYTLPTLSAEQQAVIEAVKSCINAKVSGVAGCGKTTTILGICSSCQDKQVLVLTYNARLKIETRQKVEALQLSNTEVHSYHAMCVKYYSKKGSKDDGIIDVVNKDLSPKKYFQYDIIILDECQDMTKCYYMFVKKIIKDNKRSTQLQQSPLTLCLFGDEKQNIFDFKGADERFLTHAEHIFKNESKWKELQVHTSFRVTNQIAGFVNKYLIGYEKLKAPKEGSKVRYMYINPFEHITKVYDEVLYYLGKGYKYQDIFVLAPSIKKKIKETPIVKLENMLVKDNIPCFAPISDDSKIDEEVIQGKIVFSTFHQVKGLERPVVIVFGFDISYFKYYARNACMDKCPNAIYVATTRALENLTVVHACGKQPLLSTITYDEITRDPNVTILHDITYKPFKVDDSSKDDIQKVVVTELIKFLEPQVINHATKMLDFSVSKETSSNHAINLPQKVVCTKNKTAEIVYDINGYVIPTYFEMFYNKSCTLLNRIRIKELDISYHMMYNKIAFKFGQDLMLPTNYLLYICTLYDATINGYHHRTKQIASYDWLTNEDLEKCNNILKCHIKTEDIYFEYPIKKCHFLNTKYALYGVIDIIDKNNNIIWEIKCTSSIDNEHIIQLAIYAWLWNKHQTQNLAHHEVTSSFKLLNVCTSEVVTLLYNHEQVTTMIEYLLENKYQKSKLQTDTEFIESCNLY